MYPALALWIWSEAVQTAIVKSFSTHSAVNGKAAEKALGVPEAPNLAHLLPMAMRLRLDHLRNATHSLLTATRFDAERYRSL